MGVTDISHEWADGTRSEYGITVYPDGTWTADGFTHYKDGSIKDPDGNLHHLDGTWEDPDGHVHSQDGSWQDDEGYTHYDDGSVTTPQGVNVAKDGGSVAFPTQDVTGSAARTNDDPYAGYVDGTDNSGDIYDDTDPTYWSDEYGAQGTSSDNNSNPDDNTSDDSHSDDHPDDIYDDVPTPDEPPAPDNGPSGSTPDPDGGGDETPSLGHHKARAARGGTPAGHGITGGDSDGAGGGYGWTHFGAPRSDDGDNGDEKPSLGHRAKPSHTGHGPHLPGSGLQGSTGDSDYVGGGYGWNLHGAPRADTAVPGTGGSVASALGFGAGTSVPTGGTGLTTYSEETGTGPTDGKGKRHARTRVLVTVALLAALPIGGFAFTFGGADDSATPVAPLVIATSTPTVPSASPAQPVVTANAMPTTMDQPAPDLSTGVPKPPVVVDETETAPTFSVPIRTTSTSAPTSVAIRPAIAAPVIVTQTAPVLTPNPQHHRAPEGSSHGSVDAAPRNTDSAPRQRSSGHRA